jgi:Arabinose-binding domain of AraC transcription regulator, N-term
MDLNPDDTVYPVAKIALVLDALAAAGVPKEDALRRVRLSEASVSLPATRVSLNQVIDCCSYAAERSPDPHFAYHTGLRFHVSAYGMYGFAILSSMNYRQTMKFAVKYHQLATPLVTMEFEESDGCGIWQLNPLSHARINARLYKFIVEMQFGIVLSLHRDFMGSPFLCGNFRLRIPHLAMRQMRPSSGRQSCSDNQRIGCCSIRAGSTVRQGLAMKSLTRPW